MNKRTNSLQKYHSQHRLSMPKILIAKSPLSLRNERYDTSLKENSIKIPPSILTKPNTILQSLTPRKLLTKQSTRNASLNEQFLHTMDHHFKSIHTRRAISVANKFHIPINNYCLQFRYSKKKSSLVPPKTSRSPTLKIDRFKTLLPYQNIKVQFERKKEMFLEGIKALNNRYPSDVLCTLNKQKKPIFSERILLKNSLNFGKAMLSLWNANMRYKYIK